MILLGKIVKAQGLKGELILYATMDNPLELQGRSRLVLNPSKGDWSELNEGPGAIPCNIIKVRFQKNQACILLEGVKDRTSAERFVGMSLWMPDDMLPKDDAYSYRHDWVNCSVFDSNKKLIGQVVQLEPTPMGYDMVEVRLAEQTKTVLIPYIKAWWYIDLKQKQLIVTLPPGLLDQGDGK